MGEDGGGELGDDVGAGGRDAEEGEAGGGEKSFDLMVAGLAVGALVGGIVEFDGEERAEGGGVADDEVEAALGGAVLPGLTALGVGEEEELAQGDLGEDVALCADDLAEDEEEGAFGVGGEAITEHDFRRGLGGSGRAVAEEVGEEAEEAAGGFFGHGWGPLKSAFTGAKHTRATRNSHGCTRMNTDGSEIQSLSPR